MIRTINVCDQCGAECPYESIYARAGWQRLPTGEQETVDEAVDLCPIHMRALMQTMVACMNCDAARAWVKTARDKKPPIRM